MAEAKSISIEDFRSERWEKFEDFESFAEKGLTKLTRELPPELHEYIRSKLLEILISTGFLDDGKHMRKLRASVTIDANIIIQDSFRVASGRTSSTERILASPYIEVLAPKDIEEEVESKIHEKLPRGASLKKALTHARKLLARVKRVSKISREAIKSASTILKQHSPEDIRYLALAIDRETDAIISRDKKAFDRQIEVKRWELKDAVEVVVTYESGALSLFVLGTAGEVVLSVFERILIILLNAFVSVLEIVATLFNAIVEKSVELLSKIPEWVWIIIITGSVGALLLSLFNEEFRNWVKSAVSDVASVLNDIANDIIETGKILWNALKSVLIWFWDLIRPVGSLMIIIAGVLGKRAWQLLMREIAPAAGNTNP